MATEATVEKRNPEFWLEHEAENCKGGWIGFRAALGSGRRTWECSDCGAMRYATPETDIGAASENLWRVEVAIAEEENAD